ncbi:ABC transporter permease [Candidatus Pacearchaeota archaeon]|nr:ABC transporter permease [Candidatus Pacearchaeota archaeon]
MGVKGRFSELKSIFGLSLSLAKANFKLRNEGSYLGIFWYLLEPLFLFGIILYLQPYFSSGSIQKYPLYLLIGLIIFNFFSQATNLAVNSISGNKKFLTSMKIRKEVLVLSSFFQTIFSHFFEIIILIIFLIIYRHNLVSFAYYPIVFIILGFFTLGACFILATLGAFVNDIQNVWRVISRLLWFATPIFYVLREPINFIFYFNPLYYYITLVRTLILGNVYPYLFLIFMAIFMGLISFIIGICIFNKYKNKFAEVV